MSARGAIDGSSMLSKDSRRFSGVDLPSAMLVLRAGLSDRRSYSVDSGPTNLRVLLPAVAGWSYAEAVEEEWRPPGGCACLGCFLESEKELQMRPYPPLGAGGVLVLCFGVLSVGGLVPRDAAGQRGVDAAAIREGPPGEWLTYGRDYAETHYSPLAEIDASNVHRLGVAWSWDLPKTGARLEATPLVSDGVIYATAPLSLVFALDARTGQEKWHWDPGIPDEEQGGPSVCCGDVNRGVALYDDKVYAGLLDGRLVALDRETGGGPVDGADHADRHRLQRYRSSPGCGR